MSSPPAVVSRGMSRVIFDTSMSLDGFMAGANVRPEEPMGDGGERLHEWVNADRGFLAEAIGSLGAVIAGRRTYDLSLPYWGADGPTAAARVPVFVVTHEPPSDPPENGVYTFVTDGIESAVEQAKAAADGKLIGAGGASLGRQLIQAGLLDEIRIHQVPVLFGAGTSMFGGLEDRHIELEPIEVIHTPNAIHQRFEVVRA
jgi:dihydrofolate reductase